MSRAYDETSSVDASSNYSVYEHTFADLCKFFRSLHLSLSTLSYSVGICSTTVPLPFYFIIKLGSENSPRRNNEYGSVCAPFGNAFKATRISTWLGGEASRRRPPFIIIFCIILAPSGLFAAAPPPTLHLFFCLQLVSYSSSPAIPPAIIATFSFSRGPFRLFVRPFLSLDELFTEKNGDEHSALAPGRSCSLRQSTSCNLFLNPALTSSSGKPISGGIWLEIRQSQAITTPFLSSRGVQFHTSPGGPSIGSLRVQVCSKFTM